MTGYGGMIEELMRFFGISLSELARVFSVSERALQEVQSGRNERPFFAPDICQLGRVRQMLVCRFETDEAVRVWLESPRHMFGWSTPKAVLLSRGLGDFIFYLEREAAVHA